MSDIGAEDRRLQSLHPKMSAANLAISWAVDGASLRLVAGSAAADDCAIIDVTGSCSLVMGSDYVRGPKFTLYQLGLMDAYDLGRYLTVANISDLAAMGATPVAFLSVIRYPSTFSDDDFDSVVRGIADACRAYGANPVGGDIGSAERLILSGSAFGVCESGRALRRSGARPEDLLCVTGPVGTPGAALVYFDRVRGQGTQLPRAAEQELLESWRNPTARVAAGQALLSSGYARACQDVSDGLRATAEQLALQSGCGCWLVERKLPVEESVRLLAERAGLDLTTLALSASVDFELAFAVDPADEAACRDALLRTGCNLHVVGRFTLDPGFYMERTDGRLEPLPGVTWQHQGTRISDLVESAARRGIS